VPQTLGGPDYYATINYAQSDFYSSSVRMDGQTVVMHAQVAYGDMLSFEITMKGYCAYNGQRIIRYPPQPHYHRPLLFCTQVDFVRELSTPTADARGNLNYTDLLSDGKSYGQNGYGKVEMACTFEPAPYGMIYLPDSRRLPGQTDELWRAVARRREHEVTSQQLPKHGLAFAPGSSAANQPVPAAGAIVIATQTVYYETTWPLARQDGTDQLAGNLEANIANGIGTINSVTFDGIYPPYTCLALAPKREMFLQANQTFAMRLIFPFAIRGTKDLSASDADSSTPNWIRILNGSPDSATAYSQINRAGAPTKFAYGVSDHKLLFTP
jgi:hypothetical protein